jgi:hypothetical protein
MTYEIITIEGAVWQEAFPKAIDAFAWATGAIQGDRPAEVICEIRSEDDTVTGVVTVWQGRIKEQHHIRVRPHRLNARVAA